MARRIVITGLGAVTPLGLNLETTWENLMKSKSGIDYISIFDASSFPVKIAAEVKGFEDAALDIPEELEPFAGRSTKFALSACKEAIQHAGLNLDTLDPTMFGISLGGNEETSKLSDFSNAYRDDNLLSSLQNRDLSYFSDSQGPGQNMGSKKMCPHHSEYPFHSL